MKFPALIVLIMFLATEIYLFRFVGGEIGFGWTIMLVFASMFIGVNIIRRQGFSVFTDMQRDLAAGKQPVIGLMGSLLIFLGGFLLIIPGFFTDIMGFILLTRLGRRVFSGIAIGLALPALFNAAASRTGYQPNFSDQETRNAANDTRDNTVIIDGDYRIDDERQ